MTNKTGGSAFPVQNACMEEGMTLRDYFAAKAMQAIITKLPVVDQQGVHGQPVPDKVQHNLDIAESAYWIADAMIQARDVV